MKLIPGLFVLAIAVGIGAPAQAQPTYLESKGVTYAINGNGVGRVSALITSTGAPVWTTGLVATTSIPPDIKPTALALDKDILYVSAFSPSLATNSGFVFSLDAVSGRVVWIAVLPGGGIFSPATVDRNVVYVASWADSGSSRTSAVDAATGAIIWQSNTPYPAFSSPTIDKDRVVLVSGGFSGFPTFLIHFDPATGQIVRSVPVP